jgi:predicted RNA-binding Zn ribbon-like protein
MASVVVDGLVVPLAVTDDPALNFCNTRAGWGSSSPKEYLHSHAHLCVWAGQVGLLTPREVTRQRRLGAAHPDQAAAALARTVALRDAVYAVLVLGSSRRDWATINAEVRAAGAASSLAPGRPAVWALDASTVDMPMHAVARAVASLLTRPDAALVAACPGTGCGWVFVDPRGRRRWCSMAWCGNRNKARRHAERSRRATTL